MFWKGTETLVTNYINLIWPGQCMICRFKGSKIPDKLFAQGSYDCAGSGLMPPLKTTKLNSGYGSPAFKEGLPKAIIKFLDL